MVLLRRPLALFAAAVLLGTGVGIGYWLATGRSVAAPRTYTCGMDPQVRQDGPGLCPVCHMELVPADGKDADDGGPGISIDPVVVQNSGVRTQPVAEGELVQDLRLFGAVQIAQDRQRDVSLKFPGIAEVLYANRDGMAIRKGDPLFELYSPELLVAEERLLSAKQTGIDNVVVQTRQKLERWDMPAASIDALLARGTAERLLPWPSPYEGILVQRNIAQGGRIDVGASLLRIADLSTIWVEAQVPESRLRAVAPGMDATVLVQADPGRTRTGKVTVITPVVDERTRTATLRIVLANDDGSLLPGMHARVHLRTVRNPRAVLIPHEAVLDTGTRQLAWVATGQGRFEPRQLTLGEDGDGGVVEVKSGLRPGEPVVVSGQFLIDAESRLREGLRKFSGEGLAGAAPTAGAEPAAEALPAAAQQAVDAAFAAYRAVCAACAADRDDPAAWQAQHDAAQALAPLLPAALQPLATALATATAARPADLAARREALLAVSNAAIALFERGRPTAAVGPRLYVVFCSMKPGHWLQTDTELRNPYYGSEMLECGKVLRSLPTAAGSQR